MCAWVSTINPMSDLFPIRRNGEALMDLEARLGAKSAQPLLEECTVCGRTVWRSDLHAHRACLEGLGVEGLGFAPPPPDRPDPVVGMVYATINEDSAVSKVSDRAARDIERAAAERIAAMPKCDVCGKPMVLRQRGAHTVCKERTDLPPNEGRMH